jgi:hypothetical protein
MMNYNPSLTRCARCVMPEVAGHIDLDEEGLCPVCAKQDELVEKAEDFDSLTDDQRLSLLKKKVERFRSQGKYDCCVSLSGGKDSTMVLYIAKKLLGLNPLAITIDNGFVLPKMYDNVAKATSVLGVDFVTYKTEDFKKLYPYLIKSGRKVYYCRFCHALLDVAIHTLCSAFDIHLILGGYTKGQQYVKNFELFWIYDQSDANSIELLRQYPEYAHLAELFENQSAFFHKHYGGIVQVSPFKYLKYDEHEIVDILGRELGFEKTAGCWPSGSSNCTFNYVAQYLALQQFGYAQHESEQSRLVRAGEVTRERALEVIETPITEQDMAAPLSQIGLTLKDIVGQTAV